MNNNQQLNINNLIQTEVDRISTKYDKDFLVLQTENKEIKIDIEKVSGAKSVFDW